jgi:two-component system response regulator NreC
MPKIRILIADDHALVRAGLRALLSASPDIEVVGEAADGVAVVEQCRHSTPDVVLMDLTMPGRGGIGAIHDLRRSCPNVKVLVLSMQEDETFVRQALLAGASGYVMKKSLASELTSAIHTVHRGDRHIPTCLATAGEPERVPSTSRRSTSVPESLTLREREVTTLIALGHTNLEIAERLHISGRTVETHRKHIADKLNLPTRADLVRFAIEHGLMGA